MRGLERRSAGVVFMRLVTLACFVTGFAISVTAMAAEPNNDKLRQRRPSVCTQQYEPVCGELNGIIKTYSNACFAAADGAKVIAKGHCR